MGSGRVETAVKAEVHKGDVVVVFSNGGFDGIHGKLLEVL
jgi:UDP-N-acetylmuramate: L-alanyl-gamma-D-glutamyl-meso-diaminopimelate ligase